MKILIIILLFFATNLFAQIESDGLNIGKLGLNKTSAVDSGTTAIDSIAYVLGTGNTILERVKDAYPVLYSFKKLFTTQTDTCVMLQRTLNSDSAYFGFVNGILDTASVRSWLDTSVLGLNFLAGMWTATSGTVKNSNNTYTTPPNGGGIYTSIIPLDERTYKLTIEGSSTATEFQVKSPSSGVTYMIGFGTVIYKSNNVGIWFTNSDSGTTNITKLEITEITPSVRKWWDASGNGNHAVQYTSANQPIYNDSLAIRFDGVDDYLDIGTDLTYSTATYIFGINGNVSTENNILSRYGGFQRIFVFSGDIYIETNTNGEYFIFSNSNLTANTYYNIAISRISDNASLYKDGAFVQTVNTIGADVVTIRYISSSAGIFYNGIISPVIISKYGFTQPQIQSINTYLQ